MGYRAAHTGYAGIKLPPRELLVVFAFFDRDGGTERGVGDGLDYGEFIYAFYNRRKPPRISERIRDICKKSTCSLQPPRELLQQKLQGVDSLPELCHRLQTATNPMGLVKRCLQSVHGVQAVERALRRHPEILPPPHTPDRRVLFEEFYQLDHMIGIDLGYESVLPRTMIPGRVTPYYQQCRE